MTNYLIAAYLFTFITLSLILGKVWLDYKKILVNAKKNEK